MFYPIFSLKSLFFSRKYRFSPNWVDRKFLFLNANLDKSTTFFGSVYTGIFKILKINPNSHKTYLYFFVNL